MVTRIEFRDTTERQVCERVLVLDVRLVLAVTLAVPVEIYTKTVFRGIRFYDGKSHKVCAIGSYSGIVFITVC